MPRYIDADAFREAVLKGMRYQHDKQLLINHSYTFPTADVREVKRGRWIKEDNTCYSPFDGSPPYWYVCSLCKRYERNVEPYCNCGAEMVGGEN